MESERGTGFIWLGGLGERLQAALCNLDNIGSHPGQWAGELKVALCSLRLNRRGTAAEVYSVDR